MKRLAPFLASVGLLVAPASALAQDPSAAPEVEEEPKRDKQAPEARKPAAPAQKPAAPAPANPEPPASAGPPQNNPAGTEAAEPEGAEPSEAEPEGAEPSEAEPTGPDPNGPDREGAGPAEASDGAPKPDTLPSPQPQSPEGFPPPASAQHGRKSATARQTADLEAPDDDYAGATDDALVEQKKPQGDLSLGIALDLTLPLGTTADFVRSASVQGLSLDLRYYAFGNIGVGVGVALDSLSEKDTRSVVWDGATFTGTQVRELSFTPITLKGYYAWREPVRRFVPYVAAGVGAARAVRRLVVGYSSLAEDSWHLALVPEAGLQIPAGPTVVLTNVRLNYLPPSGGADEHLFATFSVGLSVQ